jgi:hypothetical protein
MIFNFIIDCLLPLLFTLKNSNDMKVVVVGNGMVGYKFCEKLVKEQCR